MKKFLMLAMMAMFCQWGYSQYQPGDYYQEDGLDCVVIKVNEDGQSGLVMTLPGVVDWRNGNFRDVDSSDVNNFIKSVRVEWKNLAKAMEAILEKRMEYRDELLRIIGEDGSENMEKIEAWCGAQNVSFAELFPEYDAVKRLGNGWFLPGIQELESFGCLMDGGKDKIPYGELWNAFSRLNDKMPQDCRNIYFIAGYDPINPVLNLLAQEYKAGTLGADLEERAGKNIKYQTNKMSGGYLVQPYNLNFTVKCSSMIDDKRQCMCIYGFLGGKNIILYGGSFGSIKSSSSFYANATTCAVKMVDF